MSSFVGNVSGYSMDGFDMKTAVVVFVFVEYISAYVFAITWWQNKRRFSGIGHFFIGFLIFAIGMTLAVLQDFLPIPISVVAANLLMFFSHILFLFGLSAFYKIKTNKAIYYAYTISFALIYGFFSLIEYDVNNQTIVFNSMILPIYLHMLYLLYFKVKNEDGRYTHNLGIVLIAFFVMSFLRTLFAFRDDMVNNDFGFSTYETIFVMISIAMTMQFVFSLQLMINRRLFKITEERAAIQKILLQETEKLATTDSLTSVFNRRKIEFSIEEEFKQAVKHGGHFSIILCDLDYFKATNDKYGHDVGDQALIETANILTELIGRAGKVGRWGGEEFMILLPKLPLKEAVQVANSIRHYLENYSPKYIENGDKLSMSFGVADNRHFHKSYTSIVKQADNVLYQAKDKGRNRVEYEEVPFVTAEVSY